MDKKIEKQHRFTQYITGEQLDLSGQALTDADMPELIRFLHEYPDIKRLDLSLNNIGDQGLNDFSERNQTVTQVNFTGNIISDYGLAIFAYKNQTIKQVNFSHNPISEQGINNFIENNYTCHSTQFTSVKYH